MKIGVDLDGVVFNSESLFATLAELYDCRELNRNSLINKKAPRVKEKYDWTKEERQEYFNKYILRDDFDIMPGAKDVIELLKKEGNEIVVVTARGILDDKEIEVAKNKLKKNGIKFDDYFWKSDDKKSVCERENIDIMIDDFDFNCRETAKSCKYVLHFKTADVYDVEDYENVQSVNNWGEVYRFIHESDVLVNI